jgi:hypothetical protein
MVWWVQNSLSIKNALNTALVVFIWRTRRYQKSIKKACKHRSYGEASETVYSPVHSSQQVAHTRASQESASARVTKNDSAAACASHPEHLSRSERSGRMSPDFCAVRVERHERASLAAFGQNRSADSGAQRHCADGEESHGALQPVGDNLDLGFDSWIELAECGLLNVCFAPDSGRTADIPGGPGCAMCGRLRVGKSFLHVCRVGRCGHVFGL